MGESRMNTYEATITIKTNPVRKANSKQEFIENLIQEYNNTCWQLFEIDENDIEICGGDE